MKKLSRSGFGAIEAILFIVLFIGLGVVGYSVYQTNQDNKQADTTKAAASQKTTTSKPTASESKAPADSQAPAASSCEPQAGTQASVSINIDVPSPRCVQVSASQTLAIKNNDSQTVTVTLGSKAVTIAAGQTGTIAEQFGNYLEVGVHDMTTNAPSGGAPEIWLK
ncbi:MAG TPA: hypothetical protein VG604_04165 [Candidatus Saccharimonadales bacterium]|nr:hypothetical protein [Candidatus Saccharimonadales bacterium]